MTAKKGDELPSLYLIQEAGGIDAILLTHAHMDHSGALPAIYPCYPKIPIYMTQATLSLVTILLQDALKIMELESEREGEIPLYPKQAVEMVLAATRPVPLNTHFELFNGDLRVTFYAAGHILGAAAIFLESKEGSILVSGDISISDQITVSGMPTPPVKPDIVVIESTYGGRKHPPRAEEERRLIQSAADVADKKGRILFPAFAVGRAQEVILILSRAIEQKKLPQIPIFVDGMVRQVCNLYRSYPELLTPWLQKRVAKLGNPFFYEGGPVTPIWDPKIRKDIVRESPAIFVSSSGMLAGGPSQFYAAKLAQQEKDFIAITGYQDEESPGRKIQEVATTGGGLLRLGQEIVELKCGVGTYGLSAHADSSEIVEILAALQPAHIVLVHGDRTARPELAHLINSRNNAQIHLPISGDSLLFSLTSPHKNGHRAHCQTSDLAAHTQIPEPQHQTAQSSHGPDSPCIKHLNADQQADQPDATDPDTQSENGTDERPMANSEVFGDSEAIRAAYLLLERDGPSRHYTLQEILMAWNNKILHLDANTIDTYRQVLHRPNSPWQSDRRRPFLYRSQLNDYHKEMLAKPGVKPQMTQRLDPNSALKATDQLFPPEAGLYRRSSHNERHTIVLSFYFPDVASERYQSQIKQLAENTGWNIEINPNVHQAELQQTAINTLPKRWTLRKNPALHLDQKLVVAHCIPTATLTEDLREFARQLEIFKHTTGFDLKINGIDIPDQVQDT
jgi:Cft2 family RNA processing exonuclease